MRRPAVIRRRRDLAPVDFEQVFLVHRHILRRSSLRVP
jgi:hypothetical protein